MSSRSDPPSGPVPAVDEAVPAWRLVLTLGTAGALAGWLIVAVFGWAQPRIQHHQAEVLSGAVDEVLGGPTRVERFFVHGGALTASPPSGVDTLGIERVFLGFDADDRPIGFAVGGAAPGYQDVVRLIFGYDPGDHRVLGMKVLDSRETPGLGDRIQKDVRFLAGFVGRVAPLIGVKQGTERASESEVDMITGATVSARTVIGIINRRVEELQPLLAAHMRGPES
jgi:Na+-translocating ferredoxin:NAD+ oxidoreductase subunit G